MYVKFMDYCHLECDSMQFCRQVLVCQRRLLTKQSIFFFNLQLCVQFFVTILSGTKVFSAFMQNIILIEVYYKFLLGFCSVDKILQPNPFTKIQQVRDTYSITVFSLQRDPKTILNPFNKAIRYSGTVILTSVTENDLK